MSRKAYQVLLAEDNAADVFLVREALQVHDVCVDVHVMDNGEIAVRFLDAVDRVEEVSPEVMLVDLNLPRVGGREVLARLRCSPICGHIPAVILSSSEQRGGQSEASAQYFTKPFDYDAYMLLGGIVKAVLPKR